jgi:hypothetical protein
MSFDATKRILSSSIGLAEDLLFLFTNWLSLVGERMSILKQRYAYLMTFSWYIGDQAALSIINSSPFF